MKTLTKSLISFLIVFAIASVSATFWLTRWQQQKTKESEKTAEFPTEIYKQASETKTGTSTTNEFQSQIRPEEKHAEIKRVIELAIHEYYSAMIDGNAKLHGEQMKELYEDPVMAERAVTQATEIWKALADGGVYYSAFKTTLTFQDKESRFSKDTASVRVYAGTDFEGDPIPYFTGIDHLFTMKRQNDRWLIVEDNILSK